VARDRQRAKARRRAREANPLQGLAPATPEPNEPPPSHAYESEDQREFEAAIVANADAEAAFGDREDEAALERQAVEAGPAPRETVPRTAPGEPTKRGLGRFVGFLRACWSELQRVQWPDRIQVAQATAVVIGFVIIAGLYLGVADYVAKQIVNAII
jgi:preprotein translocase subunit SecE